jgi:hypothetical protein
MNFTLAQLEQKSITPNVFIYQPQESLTTWGIFLSSIILSSTAFITQIIAQFQKSKCSKINCIGSSCVRDLEK